MKLIHKDVYVYVGCIYECSETRKHSALWFPHDFLFWFGLKWDRKTEKDVGALENNK